MYGKKWLCLLLALLCISMLPSCKKTDGDAPVAEEVRYDYDGSVRYRIVYAYDESGRLTEETEYGVNGAVSRRTAYTYDENGVLTETLAHRAPLLEGDEPTDLRTAYATTKPATKRSKPCITPTAGCWNAPSTPTTQTEA